MNQAGEEVLARNQATQAECGASTVMLDQARIIKKSESDFEMFIECESEGQCNSKSKNTNESEYNSESQVMYRLK